MPGQYNQYTAWFKQHVLQCYQPGVRGHGAAAVAHKFELPSHSLVLRWAAKAREPGGSLEHKPGAGRKRKLSHDEAEEHVKDFIVDRNREGKAVSYDDVARELHKRGRVDVSVRTLRRYGRKDFNITDKLTTRKLAIEGRNSFFSPPSHTHRDTQPVLMCGDDRNRGILGRHR